MNNLQRVYPELPTEVMTEVGRATIGVVLEINARRSYVCPLCDTEVSTGEKHVLVVPVMSEQLRRHLHAECLATHIQNDMLVRLHPKEPNILDYQ
jgi:hypothetical protein